MAAAQLFIRQNNKLWNLKSIQTKTVAIGQIISKEKEIAFWFFCNYARILHLVSSNKKISRSQAIALNKIWKGGVLTLSFFSSYLLYHPSKLLHPSVIKTCFLVTNFLRHYCFFIIDAEQVVHSFSSFVPHSRKFINSVFRDSIRMQVVDSITNE